MLAMTLSLALLMQAPGSCDWSLASGGGRPVAARSVEGAIELTRGDAEASAEREARRIHREELESWGQELAASLAPSWLPQILVRGEVQAWAARHERMSPLRISRLETVTHRYSYGKAYQTTAHLGSRDADSRDAEARLERRFRQVGKILLAKCGGIAVFWGLLAFLSSWFDRLTRGYMTWRLRLIAMALGLTGPALVLLA